jgi:hypothetical protein
MLTVEQVRSAVANTNGESGPLRKLLSERHRISVKEVSQQLSMLVESKQLIRLNYGKTAWYMLVTDVPADTPKEIMMSALRVFVD